MSKVLEIKDWTPEPSLVAFYTQKYYINEDGALPKDNFRTLAFMFIPNGKDTYKRVLIDTFVNGGLPVKINGAFLANADTDNVKELVIMAASAQKDKEATGTLYMNRVYDNIGRLLPGKLKRLDDMTGKIDGGFDGVKDGKAAKAKYRSEKEITEALKKMGYN
jgi:hypothetical protein